MRFQSRFYASGIAIIVTLVLLNQFDNTNYVKSKMSDPQSQFCANESYQMQVDYIASNLKVEIIANEKTTIIQVTNSGQEDILNCDWEIYFSIITSPIKPNHTSKIFRMSHVNGFLYKLKSKSPPEESLLILNGSKESIKIDGNMIAKNFAYPNWFIIGPNTTSRIITSTNVTNQPYMVKINSTYSSEQRFAYNKLLEEGPSNRSEAKLVIPTPMLMVTRDSFINISSVWKVKYDSVNLANEAQLIADFFGILATQTSSSPDYTIALLLVPLQDIPTDEGKVNSTEAYLLTIMPDFVYIMAPSPAGIFYGVQTIMSLCRNNMSVGGERWLPIVEITDVPRYSYRGLMIDVSRHFQSVETIKKLIRVMSSYKMNHLHLHLSDDEGWRVNISALPELISIGAHPTAKYNSTPKFNFLNSYDGTVPINSKGPSANPGTNSTRQYYTMQDYFAILDHASLHHVTLVPECDFPGHSHAALVSMRARKLALRAQGDPNAEAFDLEDEADTSDDSSVNDVADTVINVCKNSSIDFMRRVVDEIIKLHENRQPLSMIHLGGDEVSRNALLKSPICQSILHPDHKNVSEYIIKQLLDVGDHFNKTVVLWDTEEMLGLSFNESSPVVHFWTPSKERDKTLRAYLKAGVKIILSEANFLYLDHPSEPSTLESGLRWAVPSISEFDIFGYIPPNPCLHGDDDDECKRMMSNVLGIQGNLWGELIWDGENMLDQMAFPRLLAVAERAWHQAKWQEVPNSTDELMRDWSTFAQALGDRELKVLDDMGVNYRIPIPGARRITDEKFEYNVLIPNLRVVMSTDGGSTWTAPGDAEDYVLLATLSADGKRKSRFTPLGSWMDSNTSTSQAYHSKLIKLQIVDLILICCLLFFLF